MNAQADFKTRVARAAAHIASGRPTTRTFDNCFENNDGDAVAAALLRRVEKRPDGKLAQNIWHYLSEDTVRPAAERLRGLDLETEAAKQRAASRAKWEAMWEQRRKEQERETMQ